MSNPDRHSGPFGGLKRRSREVRGGMGVNGREWPFVAQKPTEPLEPVEFSLGKGEAPDWDSQCPDFGLVRTDIAFQQ